MRRPLHLAGGSVWTGWPERPRAASMTIGGGRVIALDEPPPPPPACDVIDLRGATAVPGLIDAHLHLLAGGASLRHLDLSAATTREAFEALVAARHAVLPPGEWLIAVGWCEQRWPGAAWPDRSWLTAAGDRPTVCHRVDGHAVLVNEPVLRAAGVPDGGDALDRFCVEWAARGGRIGRDPATGRPTGLLVEQAAWRMITPIVPRPGADVMGADLLAAQRHLHRLGVTAVGAMEHAGDLERVLRPRRGELTLRCRITLLDPVEETPFAGDAPHADGDERLAVIGCKAFIDGTLGTRTARMREPYADDPGNRGLLVEQAAEGTLLAWARAVAAGGGSPAMHAIGDEAVGLALDVARDLADRGAAAATCEARIEHAQTVDRRDLPRFAGVIASMQPLHKTLDADYAPARLGAARLACVFPFRDLARAGARLAFGSDWPVVSADPIAGIRAAVTGLTAAGVPFLPEQNLTVEEALRAYTAGAARALRLDDAGVLAPGRLGDVTVLDRDPFTADWADAPPRVVITVVGGEVVHEATERRSDGGRG